MSIEGKKRKPNPLGFLLLMLAAALAFGVLIVLFGPAWMQRIFNQVDISRLSTWPLALGALALAICVHEIGHLAAALFLNFRILEFAIGPWRFERQLRISWTRFDPANWFYFSVSAVPLELRNWWRGRVMTVIAAGPVFTLMLLAISIYWAVTAHSIFWSVSCEINLFLFFLGFAPNGSNAKRRNDAQLFYSLLRNGRNAEDMKACHQALELGWRGVRPRDYPREIMLGLGDRAEGRAFTRTIISKRMVEWAVDRNDIALAEIWDDYGLQASSECSPQIHNAVLAESACFALLFLKNRRMALSKFSKVDFKALLPPYLAERSTAAWLIACDLPTKAPAHIVRAQYVLPKGIAYYDYERDILGELHIRAINERGGGLLAAPQNAIVATAGRI